MIWDFNFGASVTAPEEIWILFYECFDILSRIVGEATFIDKHSWFHSISYEYCHMEAVKFMEECSPSLFMCTFFILCNYNLEGLHFRLGICGEMDIIGDHFKILAKCLTRIKYDKIHSTWEAKETFAHNWV
ncbi:hypothetical protein TSUD_187620 [Trifolium subterraneum]|uniref:Uncharacterized protein n=1 Tax=Trifolium subterraneum TaxID=3900 RepID=A0A2Z6PJZ3_TRISU|nr:hypothetical protein TSUD_187620 [Trifolium subterraneum]